jgi:hypothetical protein
MHQDYLREVRKMTEKQRETLARYRKKYKVINVYVPPDTAAELTRKGHKLAGLCRELLREFCKREGVPWVDVARGKRGRPREEIEAAILDGVELVQPGELAPVQVLEPAPEEPAEDTPKRIDYDLDFYL